MWLLHEKTGRHIVARHSRPDHDAVSPSPEDIPAAWRDAPVVHLAPMPFARQAALVHALRRDGRTLALDPHLPLRADTLAACRPVLAAVDALGVSDDELALQGAYDNPRQNAYANGPLPDEHRHQLKVQMSYHFDAGLTLGFDYLFETGGPYDRLYENYYDGAHNSRRAGRGYSAGADPNDPSDDKPLRLADYTDLDLRASFDLNQYIGQDISLVAEIENVLNLQGVTSVQEEETQAKNWGQPTNRQSPFQATVGATYHY